MIRRLLVPLDPSDYTAAALQHACALARRHDAEVTGIAILDLPDIEKSIGAVPVGGLYYAEKLEEHREHEAQQKIDALLETFERTCRSAGVRHRAADLQGPPSSLIVEKSTYFDLVVMGLRTYYTFETSDTPSGSLEDLLDHSVTPIWAVPAGSRLTDGDERKLQVLIIVDEGLPGARAIHRFADLDLAEMVQATLLVSGPDEATARSRLDDVVDFLGAHGIRDVATEWTTRNLREMTGEAYFERAELVVLGAHPHRGLLGFLVESLPQKLIREERTTLLLGL